MTPGRYNFEFYRHTCGRTISIYDTEPCECEKKSMKQHHTVLGGLLRPLSEAPIYYKQMMRLIRRAREHHVHLEAIITGKDHATVVFFSNLLSDRPGRVIRVRDDGLMIPEILYVNTQSGRRNDPHASMRRVHARLSWQELDWATYCRSRGWTRAARATLAFSARNRDQAERV